MRAWRVHEYGQPLDVLQLDTVPVPDVTGMSVTQATAVMQDASLSVANVFGKPDKKVFVTDPSAGVKAKKGSSVNLYTR